MLRFILFAALCIQLSAMESIEVKLSRRAVNSGEAVTFGIPFEQGKVKDISRLYLTDKRGKKLPLQKKINARWQDGSVKWALFDTFAAGISSVYLRQGEKTVSPELLAVKKKDCWEIRNGKYHLQIPGKNALFSLNGFPAEWTMSLTSSPGDTQEENWLVFIKNEGKRRLFSSSQTPLKVTVEENGPLRATVAIHGNILDNSKKIVAPFILRLTTFKNDPVLRVQNTFVAGWDVNKEFLRSMAIRLRFPVKEVQFKGKHFPLKDQRFSCSVIGSPRFHHLVSWKNKKAPEMKVHLGQKLISQTAAAPAQLKAGDFTMAVLDFHRLYPKELAADKNGLIFGIWPESVKAVLDLRRRSQVRKIYHDYENPYGGFGVAKTHDLAIAVGRINSKDFALTVQEPLLAGAAPEYYRKTLACGEFMVRNEKMFPRIEALSSFHFRYLRKMRTAGRFDGMMDWGDVPLGLHGAHQLWSGQFPRKSEKKEWYEASPFRGYWGWCNGDFAITHGFFLYFLRSGDFKVLRDGIEMSRHVMDVDTVHYMPQRPQYVGLGRRHDQQHWGSGINYGYAPDAWVYHYLLTGDHRALEVLKETLSSPLFYYGRFVAVRLWEITGDRKYLKLAQSNIKKEIDLSRPYPFKQNNFRFNSYDAPGLIHTDIILRSPVLRQAAVKAAKQLAERWPFPLSFRGHPPYAVLALAAKYAPNDPETTEVMKIRVEMLKKDLPSDPSQLNKVTDSDSMERFDAAKYKNYPLNTSVMSLYIHTALPYMLEQLRLKGIDEEQCFAYLYRWVDFPEVREVLEPAKIKKQLFRRQPHDYMYSLKTPLFRDYPGNLKLSHDDMMKYKKAVRRLKLYENGKLIGPVSWRHRLMWQNGTLGFSCWGGALSLTTQDNSHPGENGRQYTIVYTPEAKWKYEDVPSFKEKLKKIWPYPDITKVSGEWCASLEHESPLEICVWPEPPELKAKVKAARERHRFTENGKLLQNWRRDQNLIIFRTSDGSDPRTNGKKYILEYKTGDKK